VFCNSLENIFLSRVCQTVESLDLTGLEFLWHLITDCSSEDIADLAIDYFLQKTYLSVNAKLKKDSITLHQVLENGGFENGFVKPHLPSPNFPIDLSIG
jgi:hypothetical protein